jgi:hypothetical protein
MYSTVNLQPCGLHPNIRRAADSIGLRVVFRQLSSRTSLLPRSCRPTRDATLVVFQTLAAL